MHESTAIYLKRNESISSRGALDKKCGCARHYAYELHRACTIERGTVVLTGYSNSYFN